MRGQGGGAGKAPVLGLPLWSLYSQRSGHKPHLGFGVPISGGGGGRGEWSVVLPQELGRQACLGAHGPNRNATPAPETCRRDRGQWLALRPRGPQAHGSWSCPQGRGGPGADPSLQALQRRPGGGAGECCGEGHPQRPDEAAQAVGGQMLTSGRLTLARGWGAGKPSTGKGSLLPRPRLAPLWTHWWEKGSSPPSPACTHHVASPVAPGVHPGTSMRVSPP